jgi:7,8-dihydro-6-hydroxymethylpterin-pyrophosphokinase
MEPATKELARLEGLAEDAYSKMYDTPPMRSPKDAYDDACMYFHQAIEEAKRLGMASEVERLTKRSDHVRAVYNSQFRM